MSARRAASYAPLERIALPRSWLCDDVVLRELEPGLTYGGYDETDLRSGANPELEECDALIAEWPVTAETIDRLTRLRLICIAGTGVWDHVDTEAADRRSIVVCNVRDYAANAIAEFTLAMMVNLLRGIPQVAAEARTGVWPVPARPARELHGSVVGIIGLGSVGSRVAYLAEAIGMDVFAAVGSGGRSYRVSDAVRVVGLHQLLQESDVVTLHARLSSETRHMLGSTELALLKPGAVLVNTARGALIDEDALVDALENGRLAGAALDVFEEEPLPAGHRLRGYPSVILTPHMAGATDAAAAARRRASLRNILAFNKGTLTSVVNRAVFKRAASGPNAAA